MKVLEIIELKRPYVTFYVLIRFMKNLCLNNISIHKKFRCEKKELSGF